MTIKDLYKKIPESIINALKEGARIVVIAVLDFLLVAGVLNTIVHKITGTFLPTEVVESIIVALGLILKTIDKYLHELGKATGNDSLTLGLTRF